LGDVVEVSPVGVSKSNGILVGQNRVTLDYPP
jgi:hypothetical protein